jgi:Gas vesicle protein G
VFILDSLLVNGITFVLDKVREVAEQQVDNPEVLQQQLLEAQMQLEEGAIDEATFAAIERDLFARIREMKQSEPAGGIADAGRFHEVEIEIDDDERS